MVDSTAAGADGVMREGFRMNEDSFSLYHGYRLQPHLFKT